MLNYKQFKQKKKRVTNPDIVRPNLMTHEKKLKESQITIESLQNQVYDLERQLSGLKLKYNDIQASVSRLINYMRQH
jgi:hypothetical protein